MLEDSDGSTGPMVIEASLMNRRGSLRFVATTSRSTGAPMLRDPGCVDVAEVARRHHEVDRPVDGTALSDPVDIRLGDDATPVDRVHDRQIEDSGEFAVCERRFDEILTVVEGPVDREVDDVVVGHGGHLAPLHLRHPFVWVKDHDVDVRATSERFDRRGPGVARGRTDDRDVSAGCAELVFEQLSEQLHRQILEGKGRAVEELGHRALESSSTTGTTSGCVKVGRPRDELCKRRAADRSGDEGPHRSGAASMKDRSAIANRPGKLGTKSPPSGASPSSRTSPKPSPDTPPGRGTSTECRSGRSLTPGISTSILATLSPHWQLPRKVAGGRRSHRAATVGPLPASQYAPPSELSAVRGRSGRRRVPLLAEPVRTQSRSSTCRRQRGANNPTRRKTRHCAVTAAAPDATRRPERSRDPAPRRTATGGAVRPRRRPTEAQIDARRCQRPSSSRANTSSRLRRGSSLDGPQKARRLVRPEFEAAPGESWMQADAAEPPPGNVVGEMVFSGGRRRWSRRHAAFIDQPDVEVPTTAIPDVEAGPRFADEPGTR